MRRGRLLLRGAIVAVATLVVLEVVVRGFALARVPYPPPPPLEQATRRSGAQPVSAAGVPFHVLVVGDSMIRGDGVGPGRTVGDELLAELTRRRSDVAWIVDNAGVGTGPETGIHISRREVEYLHRVGLGLHPDLVIFGIYVGNDFEDHDDLPIASRQHGEDPPLWSAVHAWLRLHLRSYLFLHETAYEAAAHAGLKQPLMSDFGIIARLAKGDARARDGVDHCLRTIEAGCREATEAGARCAAFLMPVQAQVHPEDAGDLSRWYGVSLDEDTLRIPNRLVLEGLAQEGVPCLDLLDPFRGWQDGPLFLKRDMHWTPDGHRLAARELAGFLDRKGLLIPAAAGSAVAEANAGAPPASR